MLQYTLDYQQGTSIRDIHTEKETEMDLDRTYTEETE